MLSTFSRPTESLIRPFCIPASPNETASVHNSRESTNFEAASPLSRAASFVSRTVQAGFAVLAGGIVIAGIIGIGFTDMTLLIFSGEVYTGFVGMSSRKYAELLKEAQDEDLEVVNEV